MAKQDQDIQFMELAISLAGSAKKSVLPNPQVGAVICINNQVVGKGFHKGPGKAHAEIEAIRDAMKNGVFDFSQASLYVNLEPCCHTKKRTPPCLPVLLDKKFKKIFIATSDPHKEVSGQSIRTLRQSGCELKLGLCRKSALKLNEIYFKNKKTKLPFVSLKLAMTFDGAIATSSGESQWITGPESRKAVHRLRSQVCAIGVGKNTILKDNPSLNVRAGRSMKKIKVVIFGHTKNLHKRKVVSANGIENIIPLSSSKSTLSAQLQNLYLEHQISHLLIEGGARLASEFLKEKLVDDLYLFYGRGFLGGEKSLRVGKNWPAKSLQSIKSFSPQSVEIIDQDIFVYGRTKDLLK